MNIIKLFASLLPFLLLTCTAFSASKPNIVFILADDLGTGDVKCYYPKSEATTPNIDKLASQGMRFTQAYAPGSVCSPSRYALLSGFYPCRGPLRHAPADHTTPLVFPTDMVTLPRFLKSNGYRTAHIGKWHLGYGKGITNWASPIKPSPNDIGFDYHLGLPRNHNDNFKTYVENNKLLWLKENITKLPSIPKPEQLTNIRYDDEVDSTLTAKAIEFMKQEKDKPFFVYLALVATHTHITPHKDFRGTSKIGQLGDYINELDYHVGEIVETLEELGQTDNTILIFSSDNGGQVKDHHSAGKNLSLRDASMNVAVKSKTAKTIARTQFGHLTNGDFRDDKGSNYEGGFRVPLIVRWPSKVKAGTTSEHVITLADTLATTAGLLGQKLPEEAGGDSFDLSSILLGEKVEQPLRRTAILQTGKGLLSFRNDDWKLRLKKNPSWQGDKADLSNVSSELYDLASDPSEKNDLAAKHPERVKELQALLQRLLNSGRSR